MSVENFGVDQAIINVEDGMQRVLGNKKLFFKLLSNSKIQENSDELIAAMESGDLESARLIAHKIKGIAANLSMTALYQVIVELEANLKAGVNGSMDELRKVVDLSVKAISQLVEEA